MWKLLRAFFLIGFCFVILYPVLMMLSKAFMSREDLYDRSVLLLLPRSFTLDNVKTAIKQLDYWSSLWNSLSVGGDGGVGAADAVLPAGGLRLRAV